MAVPAFVDKITGFTSFSATNTVPFNVGSLDNKFVAFLAGVYSGGTTTAPTGCTYAGVALTASDVLQMIDTGQRFKLFYGATAANGANDFVASYDDGASHVVGVGAAYSGVDPVNPVVNYVSGTVGSTAMSLNPANTAGNMGLLLGFSLVSSNVMTVTSGIERINENFFGTGYGIEDAVAAEVLSGTLASVGWLAFALSLKAAVAGAAPRIVSPIQSVYF